ncbi:MAG: hypothetical protein KDB73_19760 [Planctomycetes bacterium]|nr:hypothetical protein [Planctomycetota bacterium]
MSLQRLVKLALLTLALSLPLLAPSARADDEPTDPRTVILKTYDVRDLGVTNAQLTGLRNADGTPWKPSQVSMKGGILIVRGSADEHEVLLHWIASRRARASGDQGAHSDLDVRRRQLEAHAAELERARAYLDEQTEKLEAARARISTDAEREVAARLERELARHRTNLAEEEARLRESQNQLAELEAHRAARAGDETGAEPVAAAVEQRLAALAQQRDELQQKATMLEETLAAIEAGKAGDESAVRRTAELVSARLRLQAAISTTDQQRAELERALVVLRGPESEARRKAAEEIARNLGHGEPRDRDSVMVWDPESGEASDLIRWIAGGVAEHARMHIDRLTGQAKALERQQADLRRRATALQDLASRLEADEPEKRKSLDSELVRIDRTAAELTAKREALIVQKTQLESALAEKQFDRLREQVAKLEAEAREREASRSARWPQPSTSQRAIPENEILLEEVRALRRDVREVKVLLRKLLEQDGVAVDPRGPR